MYTIDTFAILIGILVVLGAILFLLVVIVTAFHAIIRALVGAVISLVRKLAPFPISRLSVHAAHNHSLKPS